MQRFRKKTRDCANQKKQLKEAERQNEQKEKAAKEREDLRNRIERTQARVDQLGSNMENES